MGRDEAPEGGKKMVSIRPSNPKLIVKLRYLRQSAAAMVVVREQMLRPSCKGLQVDVTL